MIIGRNLGLKSAGQQLCIIIGTISLLSTFIFGIIVLVRFIRHVMGYKKVNVPKRKPFEIILAIWKGVLLIDICFMIVMTIISIILQKNLFLIQITISPLWDCILAAIGTIIAIITVYGIYKKNHTGYYASITLCTFSIISDIISIIKAIITHAIIEAIFLLPFIAFYIYIAYKIHKNKTYFGIKT